MNNNYTQLVASTLIIAILAVACAGGPAKPDADAADAPAPEPDAKTAAGGTPPQAVADALLPGYTPSLPGKLSQPAHEERFDINVNRVNARVFFMGLVQDTPINIVVHPDVDGVISLNLKNVTIDEVLEVTRDVYGYEYQKNRAGYYILPARLQSQIFNVSYLNVARKGTSTTRVNSGQFSGGDSDGMNQQGSNNSGIGNNRSNRGGSGHDYSATASSNIETDSEADFWKGLETTLYTLIGSKDGRSVVVNAQSGIVVVRAMPGELRDVENFLSSAQINLQRQVLIEAKVLEVQLNDMHQAGVNWAALHDGTRADAFASQFETIDGVSEVVDSSGKFLSSGLTGTRALPGFGNIFAIGAASDDFAVLIRLLDQQGKVNVLSSPRVSTVNNQKAVIKVGSDEFFVTEISATTTTGTATTTTPQIVLTPFFSGIALDVTPQIDDKEQVTLHIHPAISEVKDQVKDITFAGQDQSLPLAFSTVRESDSIVRAKNGQVIVIGGLMQNNQTEVESGVPLVSRIPILGHLFKQTQTVAKRSELVILLKPIVIGQDSTWESEISQVSQRMDALKP
ncbi:MAG TPA: pilus (MSHA type) biogenesis protein MshL [Gammaproteobacteria bacterium]|nr:pilus (MSHA type) biogenesis protein MshL [Gammaproteobacteria bacterium]